MVAADLFSCYHCIGDEHIWPVDYFSPFLKIRSNSSNSIINSYFQGYNSRYTHNDNCLKFSSKELSNFARRKWIYTQVALITELAMGKQKGVSKQLIVSEDPFLALLSYWAPIFLGVDNLPAELMMGQRICSTLTQAIHHARYTAYRS